MRRSNSFTFTDTALKKIKPEAGLVELVDTSRKGLRLRLYPTGKKVFVFRYRFNERSRILTIGEYSPNLSLEEANQRLSTAKLALKNKIDPGELKQQSLSGEKAKPLIPELVTEYLERHAKKKKKTWREDQRMLEKDVLPRWKYKKVADIDTRDIVNLLDKVERRSVSARNHLQTVLGRMFKFAVSNRHWIRQSPCIDIDRVEEAPRDRHLKVHEIPIFWSKLKDATMSGYMKTALKLLLVTGQRRGELAHARWEHIDLKGAEWYMPETKNGTDHTVPLSVMAVELFKRLRKETRESAYALPSPHLQIKSSRTPIEDKPIAKRSLTRALAKNREHFGLDHFTVHDLRRTVVTQMHELKIAQRTIDEVINHLPPKIVLTYDRHDYMEEKLQALEEWSLELSQIVVAD